MAVAEAEVVTDHNPPLLPGHAITIRRKPRPATGKWITDAGINLEAGDSLTIDPLTVPEPPHPPPPPDPEPEPSTLPSTVTSVLTPAALAFLTAMPQGWQRTGLDTFGTDIPQGQMFKPGGAHEFPAMTEGSYRWRQTAAGGLDTRSKQGQDGGKYYSQWTSWVQDGEWRDWLRTAPIGQVPFAHGTSGQRMVSRPLISRRPSMAHDDLARWHAVRLDLLMKFPGDEATGFKVAYLFFNGPGVGDPDYSEDDFPEFQLGAGPVAQGGFYHHESRSSKETIPSHHDSTGWHLYSVVLWARGFRGHPTGFREFRLDGTLLHRSTTYVTDDDVYYAKQAESKLAGAGAMPPLTSAGPQGIIRTRLAQILEPT